VVQCDREAIDVTRERSNGRNEATITSKLVKHIEVLTISPGGLAARSDRFDVFYVRSHETFKLQFSETSSCLKATSKASCAFVLCLLPVILQPQHSTGTW
jgi:hypothetical protein